MPVACLPRFCLDAREFWMTKQCGWPMAGKTDVFICFSSKGVEHTEALEAPLEKADLTVWRDPIAACLANW